MIEADGEGDATWIERHAAPRILTVLREALEPLAAPAIVEEIIEQALETARLRALPVQGQPLRDFVEGFLADTVEAVLGPQKADLFSDGIERVLRACAREHEAVVRQARARVQPLVLVATPEPTRAEELARLLQGRAQVEPLPDLDVVPHVLAASVASAVVLDCGAASLESSDVQQLAASASPACRLLLWGASPELESAFHLAGARDVVGCAPGASARHVARMLAALLDAS